MTLKAKVVENYRAWRFDTRDFYKLCQIVALVGTSGWADKLAGQYIDKRKRLKVISAKTPDDAV